MKTDEPISLDSSSTVRELLNYQLSPLVIYSGKEGRIFARPGITGIQYEVSGYNGVNYKTSLLSAAIVVLRDGSAMDVPSLGGSVKARALVIWRKYGPKHPDAAIIEPGFKADLSAAAYMEQLSRAVRIGKHIGEIIRTAGFEDANHITGWISERVAELEHRLNREFAGGITSKLEALPPGPGEVPGPKLPGAV